MYRIHICVTQTKLNIHFTTSTIQKGALPYVVFAFYGNQNWRPNMASSLSGWNIVISTCKSLSSDMNDCRHNTLSEGFKWLPIVFPGLFFTRLRFVLALDFTPLVRLPWSLTLARDTLFFSLFFEVEWFRSPLLVDLLRGLLLLLVSSWLSSLFVIALFNHHE